ncbi:MAG: signal recognition particle-docking protein FtsY [Halobacteriovoraceae bacterium]|nr:signal recognition particle-docking protein FtsY [Halobacteriovoraceae bacterium]
MLSNIAASPVDYAAIAAIFVLIATTFGNIILAHKKSNKTKITKEDDSQSVEIKDDAALEKSESVEPVPLKEELSWNARLFKGMARTRNDVWAKVSNIISGNNLAEEMRDELEEILFTADLSPAIVDELLDELPKFSQEEGEPLVKVKEFLQSKVSSAQQNVKKEFYEFSPNSNGPKVIMIVGVNGAGKTTTIGKLATKYKAQGAKVVVGACDTFRAAAVEQLEVWCKRADVEMVRAEEGADPSGVAFDAVAKAKEINADYCIIDTAGRLHTKSNLMDELAKTKKVMSKVIPDAPHETLLVLDAITGQNALRQAEEFNKSLQLSGLIFTKCDGSAKAGSAVSIVQNLGVPIIYIGVGENVEDLDIFDLDAYLNALLGIESKLA